MSYGSNRSTYPNSSLPIASLTLSVMVSCGYCHFLQTVLAAEGEHLCAYTMDLSHGLIFTAHNTRSFSLHKSFMRSSSSAQIL